jgi:hypothetical protein
MTNREQQKISLLEEICSLVEAERDMACVQADRLQQEGARPPWPTGGESYMVMCKNTARRVDRMRQTLSGLYDLLSEARQPDDQRLVQI